MIYCFFYFSYSYIAIYFYNDYLPSLIKIDYCSLTFCLMFSSNKPSKASASGPDELLPEPLPSPNAIILKLLILSIVYWANLVIVPLMTGILVVVVTFGVYLFASSTM